MTAQEIKDHHIILLKSLRKEGLIAKFVILLLLLIGFIISFFELKASFEAGTLGNEIREEQIIPTLAVLCAFFTVLLLFSKSIKFAYPPKIKSSRRKYKKEIYDLLTTENSEITDYLPDQKISSKEFYASNLFNTKHEDYKGDDWVKASFRDHNIVMCELRVSRLFKNIFKGLFVKCNNIENSIGAPILFNKTNHTLIDNQLLSIDTTNYIINYCKKYDTSIAISTVNGNLYIAIDRSRNLFEYSDIKPVMNLSEDIEIFNSNFEIIKCLIRDIK